MGGLILTALLTQVPVLTMHLLFLMTNEEEQIASVGIVPLNPMETN